MRGGPFVDFWREVVDNCTNVGQGACQFDGAVFPLAFCGRISKRYKRRIVLLSDFGLVLYNLFIWIEYLI